MILETPRTASCSRGRLSSCSTTRGICSTRCLPIHHPQFLFIVLRCRLLRVHRPPTHPIRIANSFMHTMHVSSYESNPLRFFTLEKSWTRETRNIKMVMVRSHFYNSPISSSSKRQRMHHNAHGNTIELLNIFIRHPRNKHVNCAIFHSFINTTTLLL